MPAVIAAGIGAGVSLFQGFSGRRSAKRQAAERRRLLDLGLANASSETFLKFLGDLQPRFRELIASNLGGSFQSAIATQLGRRGLTSTGLGASLSIGAAALPGIAAFQGAAQQAGRLQSLRANAIFGQPSQENLIPGVGSIFGNAFASGTASFFDASSRNRAEDQPLTPQGTSPATGTGFSGNSFKF